LSAAVRDGRFREDLFYRVQVLPITVPPLRERLEDIPDLVRHFLARFAAEEGKRVRSIRGEAMELLSSCPWPGNVRQLENAIFRAVVLAEGDAIGIGEFPQLAAQKPLPLIGAPIAAVMEVVANQEGPPACEAPYVAPAAPPVSNPLRPAADAQARPADHVSILDASGGVRPLDAIEADLIRFALTHYRGQMSEVARRLQIGRSTLYRRLKELGLEPDETRDVPQSGVAQE
jgi:DNA-binding NtrC family response regulator